VSLEAFLHAVKMQRGASFKKSRDGVKNSWKLFIWPGGTNGATKRPQKEEKMVRKEK
jgi:hypothetical protein